MTEAMRKKSTSSDSELSDGWSLVDHSDTTPLTQRGSGVMLLQPTPPQPVPDETQSQQGEEDAKLQTLLHTDETSSDAESVDILQDEPRVPSETQSDLPCPQNISRITTVHKGDVEKEECEELKPSKDVRKKKAITQGAGEDKADEGSEVALSSTDSVSCDYLINSNPYGGSEWFRLLIFISSLVALLLLLVSYTSLFFKEQAYPKSDGMIVLPDEDLSSLIAEITLFKDENNRLKQELNMIKYEYGTDKKIGVKTDGTLEVSPDDEFIGLEVISDDSLPSVAVPVQGKPLTGSFETTKSSGKPPITTGPPPVSMTTQERRVHGLARLEDNLKSFAKTLGLSDVVVSSYNIAKNLESIHSIVRHLMTIIDTETSPKKENKKYQLEQKLLKLHSKIEEDFKKSVEKVSKRINKFHDDFQSTYCRIKGDSSNKDNIDCSKFGDNQRPNYDKSKDFDKDKMKKEGKKSDGDIDGDNTSSEEDKYGFDPGADNTLNKDSSNVDSKLRYKRSHNDEEDDDNDSGEEKDHDKDKHHSKNYDKDKYYNKGRQMEDGHYNKNSNYNKDYTKSKDQEKYYKKDQDHSGERYYSKDDDHKREKHYYSNDQQYRIQENYKDKHYKKENEYYKHPNKNGNYDRREELHSVPKFDSAGKQLNNANKNNWVPGSGENPRNFAPTGNKVNTQATFSNVNLRKESSSDPHATYDRIRDEIPGDSQKKNSVKKLEGKKNRRYGKVVGDTYNKMKVRSAKPTAGTIHNESVYAKLISGKPRSESDGEWYLDLGRVRSQKRQRRASSSRQPGGWTFDRALVRDWCRGNSGSSLCLSFGQACNYCA